MTHLASLNKYFLKYRWRLLLGVVFILLTNYFRILSPQLTGYVVNTVVQTIRSGAEKINPDFSHYKGFDFLVRTIIIKFNSFGFRDKIFYTGIILIVLAIISGFFMFLMRQSIIVMSRLIEFDQKNEIYAHYQKLDMGFYKTHQTGDLMNRISEDVSRVRMYTGPAVMYFINLAVVIGLSAYFMLRSDLKLTLVALCPLPFLALTIYWVNTIINKKSERIQAMLSDLTTNAQESYSGIRVIKSFVQEKAMLGFFKKNAEEYKKNALSLSKTEAIYFPSMALMIGLSTLITILVGGLDVVNQVPGANVGKIAEFVMYIQMLTFPVSAIGWTASMTQRAAASQKRINEFLLTSTAIKEPSHPVETDIMGNIECINTGYVYPHTGIKALQHFSIKISKGEKIAIVGKTGSGKTTIAQLLLRMYDPTEGEVLFDGVPARHISLNHLRSSISYVPQDVFLFSDSIKNNISFGKNDASDEEIIAATQKAGIYDEIMSFENGFDTIVGERGVTLSGGQKQRISIARAILKNPRIVIFDDCLSAVDSKTENLIINQLNDFLKDKTAIIITHRIFSLFKFDRIIVMQEGKIAESGTHDTLISSHGLYFEMLKLQQESDKK